MNWKQAVMYGAFGAAGYLFFTGRRPAAAALAGLGAAVLASQYPEQFEDIWERAPRYLERASRVANGVSEFVEQIVTRGPRLASRGVG